MKLLILVAAMLVVLAASTEALAQHRSPYRYCPAPAYRYPNYNYGYRYYQPKPIYQYNYTWPGGGYSVTVGGRQHTARPARSAWVTWW